MLSLLITLQTLVTTAKDRLREEQKGATAVEYGLLVGLIAVVIIGVVVLLGPQLAGIFQTISDDLPAAPAAE
ncbi:Flp family type IVb pilin [Rathayibacter caricis DSM 15933]|jgi:pilus assembly protein Flp/PilA|uniref:Flp family type IVb pilin n=1 Tax=Rathayibacter caricis DSM 15933 TaxID=1328867 RepID=A0A2T4UPZ1_9MICO|nr:Flp family type IVb pilin [Rathayibacter caricis]PTL71598.1 Flp family type IVb pilin [Rathayibacter caricis DSM 15933]